MCFIEGSGGIYLIWLIFVACGSHACGVGNTNVNIEQKRILAIRDKGHQIPQQTENYPRTVGDGFRVNSENVMKRNFQGISSVPGKSDNGYYTSFIPSKKKKKKNC